MEHFQPPASSKNVKKPSKISSQNDMVTQSDIDVSSVISSVKSVKTQSSNATKKSTSRHTTSTLSEARKTTTAKKAANAKEARNWTETQSVSFVSFMNFTFQNHHTLPTHLNDSKWSQIQHNIQSTFYNKFQTQDAIETTNPETSHEKLPFLSLLMTEIDSNKLAIRADKNIFADVGLQKGILDMIFSYELPWVRLGFEYILRYENSNIQWDAAGVNGSESGTHDTTDGDTMSGRSTRTSSIGSFEDIDESSICGRTLEDEEDDLTLYLS